MTDDAELNNNNKNAELCCVYVLRFGFDAYDSLNLSESPKAIQKKKRMVRRFNSEVDL